MQALGQTQKEVANTDYFGVAVDELFLMIIITLSDWQPLVLAVVGPANDDACCAKSSTAALGQRQVEIFCWTSPTKV